MEKYDECVAIRKSGTTYLKAQEFIYTWTIRNFHHCHLETGKSLESPIFYAGRDDKIECTIALFPNGFDESCEDYLSIRPMIFADDVGNHTVPTAISLIDKAGKEKVTKQILLTAESEDIIKRFVAKNVVFDQDNGLLPNLIVLVKMCILADHEMITQEDDPAKNALQEIPPANRLGEFDDFEQLLENGHYSDLKLVAGGERFLVHKNILAARSRVFAAMIERGTKERNDNTVEIPDVEPEVMRELLRFVYAGKVNNIQTLACELLVAADKYELLGLKVVCEEVLIGCLSFRSIGEILKLIDKCETDKLIASAFEFLTENSKNLIKSANFNTVLKSLSQSLFTDVIEAIAMKN